MFIGRLPDLSIYGAWTSPQPDDADHPDMSEVADDDEELLVYAAAVSRSLPYVHDAVHFDGSTYLTRASLIGEVDALNVTFVIWFKMTGGDGVLQRIFGCDSFAIDRGADNKIHVTAKNAAGVEILNESSFYSYVVDGIWRCWMCGISEGSLVMNRGDSPDNSASATEENIDFTPAAGWAIGATPAGANPFSADVAQIVLKLDARSPGVGIGDDFGNSDERREYFSEIGKPPTSMYYSRDYSDALPRTVDLRVADSDAPESFATNRGPGGDWEITGTLTTASTSPAD